MQLSYMYLAIRSDYKVRPQTARPRYILHVRAACEVGPTRFAGGTLSLVGASQSEAGLTVTSYILY